MKQGLSCVNCKQEIKGTDMITSVADPRYPEGGYVKHMVSCSRTSRA